MQYLNQQFAKGTDADNANYQREADHYGNDWDIDVHHATNTMGDKYMCQPVFDKSADKYAGVAHVWHKHPFHGDVPGSVEKHKVNGEWKRICVYVYEGETFATDNFSYLWGDDQNGSYNGCKLNYSGESDVKKRTGMKPYAFDRDTKRTFWSCKVVKGNGQVRFGKLYDKIGVSYTERTGSLHSETPLGVPLSPHGFVSVYIDLYDRDCTASGHKEVIVPFVKHDRTEDKIWCIDNGSGYPILDYDGENMLPHRNVPQLSDGKSCPLQKRKAAGPIDPRDGLPIGYRHCEGHRETKFVNFEGVEECMRCGQNPPFHNEYDAVKFNPAAMNYVGGTGGAVPYHYPGHHVKMYGGSNTFQYNPTV